MHPLALLKRYRHGRRGSTGLRGYRHSHRRQIRRRSSADVELLRVLELSPGRRRTRAAVPGGCGVANRLAGASLQTSWNPLLIGSDIQLLSGDLAVEPGVGLTGTVWNPCRLPG